MRSKPVGWRQEPARHALAAKGLATSKHGRQLQKDVALSFRKAGLHPAGGYSGYKNYETWAVALWLSNEEYTDQIMNQLADEAVSGAPADTNVKSNIWTEREAARYNLSQTIKGWIEDDRDNQHGLRENDLYNDLLNAALSDVDWAEVADQYLEDKIGKLKG
jgi:hypothetical protein